MSRRFLFNGISVLLQDPFSHNRKLQPVRSSRGPVLLRSVLMGKDGVGEPDPHSGFLGRLVSLLSSFRNPTPKLIMGHSFTLTKHWESLVSSKIIGSHWPVPFIRWRTVSLSRCRTRTCLNAILTRNNARRTNLRVSNPRKVQDEQTSYVWRTTNKSNSWSTEKVISRNVSLVLFVSRICRSEIHHVHVDVEVHGPDLSLEGWRNPLGGSRDGGGIVRVARRGGWSGLKGNGTWVS